MTMTPAQFKAARDALGLTQEQLAKAIGVERNTVSRWECGESPISIMVMLTMRLLTQTKQTRDASTSPTTR